MSKYFPKLKSLAANLKIQLDSSNYAGKADLKYVTGADKSKFENKFDLASLKSS